MKFFSFVHANSRGCSLLLKVLVVGIPCVMDWLEPYPNLDFSVFFVYDFVPTMWIWESPC